MTALKASQSVTRTLGYTRPVATRAVKVHPRRSHHTPAVTLKEFVIKLRPLLIFALFVAGCAAPAFPTKVIVGATLIDGIHPPAPFSVIIVRDGIITGIGPQQTTPIPADSEKTNAIGKFVAPLNKGGKLVAGGPADLVLLAEIPPANETGSTSVIRSMRAGKWDGAKP
jgi:hypothetical protein